MRGLWFTFALLYFCFSGYYFFQATQSSPRFHWQHIVTADVSFVNSTADEVKSNFVNFSQQWNEYIDRQNSSSFWMNIVAAISLLISGIMALDFVWPKYMPNAIRYFCSVQYKNGRGTEEGTTAQPDGKNSSSQPF